MKTGTNTESVGYRETPPFSGTRPAVAATERFRSDLRLPELLVGRQPIINHRQDIIAYQLLFRTDHRVGPESVANNAGATADALFDTLNMGFDRVIGDVPAFIRINSDLLGHPLLELLPARRIVLELGDWKRLSRRALERIKGLRSRGFRFAVTDFRYRADYEELLRLVGFVKLNVHELSEEGTRREVRYLRGRGVRMIAQGVQSEADLKLARSLLINLYQGPWFTRPEILRARRVEPERARVARLADLLHSGSGITALENEFRQDPVLLFNLFRYVHSFRDTEADVHSIRKAIQVPGRKQLGLWLKLMLCRPQPDIHPEALIRSALVRGRFAGKLATAVGADDQEETLFLTGLFSVLDTLYGLPMHELLQALDLPEAMERALIRGEGPYGEYLETLRAFEIRNMSAMARQGHCLGIPLSRLGQLHEEATRWAHDARMVAPGSSSGG